jgi:hypothetical protein
MRWLALALLVPALASAAPKGWPAKGRCIAPWPSKSACIQVSVNDAYAIQQAIVTTIDTRRRSDEKPARAIALRPITEWSIGGFLLYGYEYVDFTGDVLQAVAVEHSDGNVETGFKATLGRDAKGWRVLHFEHYRQHLPQPN